MRGELEGVLPPVSARSSGMRRRSRPQRPLTSSRRRRRSIGSITTTHLPEIVRVLRPAGPHRARLEHPRRSRPVDGAALRDHRQRVDPGVRRRPGARRERALRSGRDRGSRSSRCSTATVSSTSSSRGATSRSSRLPSASLSSTPSAAVRRDRRLGGRSARLRHRVLPRGTALGVELASMDGFDVVAVGVEQEGRVVEPRASELYCSRHPAGRCRDARPRCRRDGTRRPARVSRDEPTCTGPLGRLSPTRRGSRTARLVSFPERWDPERLEHGLVEPMLASASRTPIFTWSKTTRVQSQSKVMSRR